MPTPPLLDSPAPHRLAATGQAWRRLSNKGRTSPRCADSPPTLASADALPRLNSATPTRSSSCTRANPLDESVSYRR
jgi:hypothetical protein